jgi:hypothetical protein
MVSNKEMVASLAKVCGITKYRAGLLLSLVCAELEIEDRNAFGPHTAAELERLVVEKSKK